MGGLMSQQHFLTRAHILISQNTPNKSLLAQPNINSPEQLLPDPQGLRVVIPLAITQHYQATLSQPTPEHQYPSTAGLHVVC